MNLVTDDWAVVGVYYRLYPGVVECEITYMDETGFKAAKAFCQASKHQIESYSREFLSQSALNMATEIMKEQLASLRVAIEKRDAELANRG